MEAGEEKRLELQVPFLLGSRASVLVFEEDTCAPEDDLSAAAESSLGFWDNPVDDEEWNDA